MFHPLIIPRNPMKIGIISDTHGTFDEPLRRFLADVDEIWHAGDIGSTEVANQIAAFKPLVAVHGNIDDHTLRLSHPAWQCFEREGARILLTHIGMRSGRYLPEVAAKVRSLKPTIFVCGHSHILKIFYDKTFGVLNINPGAAGAYGFHSVRTAVRFTLSEGSPKELEVFELTR